MVTKSDDVRKLAYKILVLACIPLLVFLFNSTFDPDAKPTISQEETAIVSALLSGNKVIFDDPEMWNRIRLALIRADYAHRTNQNSDVLVLGSSHLVSFSADYSGGTTVINGSFPGATLETMFGIYGIYRKRGLLPSRLILGLDPWVLNRKLQGDPRISKSLQADIQYLNALIETSSPTRSDSVFDLMGIYSFRRSISAAATTLRLNDNLASKSSISFRVVVTHDAAFGSVLDADGSTTIYGGVPMETSPESHHRLVMESIADRKTCCFNGFDELAPESKRSLESFLRLAMRDGVKLILYLPPEHPLFYEAFSMATENPIQVHMENYVRSLASNYGIPVIGSYDPIQCGLDEEDFADGDHLAPSGFEAIFLRNSCGDIEHPSP